MNASTSFFISSIFCIQHFTLLLPIGFSSLAILLHSKDLKNLYHQNQVYISAIDTRKSNIMTDILIIAYVSLTFLSDASYHPYQSPFISDHNINILRINFCVPPFCSCELLFLFLFSICGSFTLKFQVQKIFIFFFFPFFNCSPSPPIPHLNYYALSARHIFWAFSDKVCSYNITD